MAQVVKFIKDFFDKGELKFAAGTHYPLTEETERHVELQHAEKVTVADDADAADQAAAELRAKADAAEAKAVTARAAADKALHKATDAEAAAQAARVAEAANAEQMEADAKQAAQDALDAEKAAIAAEEEALAAKQ